MQLHYVMQYFLHSMDMYILFTFYIFTAAPLCNSKSTISIFPVYAATIK